MAFQVGKGMCRSAEIGARVPGDAVALRAGKKGQGGNLDGATSPAFMCTGEGLQVGAIKGYNPGEMHQACDLDHTGC